MNEELFAVTDGAQRLAAGIVLQRGMALAEVPALLAGIETTIAQAPLRSMDTPGGHRMSVTTTSCGALGWVSDPRGYRYAARDPVSDRPWPKMPEAFADLAQTCAQMAGFAGFAPDVCLINRYATGARMALHQDRDERDFFAPIVSVSLGLDAVFLLGGKKRIDKPHRILLHHGDVLVWGGHDRLRFHGILPVAAGRHELLGECRINLTFRKAG